MHPANTISLKPGLASSAQRALQALASTLSGLYVSWRRHQEVRATVHALGLLDPRTLHDLGLDRSELLSAAAEVHGQARRDRRRAWLGAGRGV